MGYGIHCQEGTNTTSCTYIICLRLQANHDANTTPWRYTLKVEIPTQAAQTSFMEWVDINTCLEL